MKKYHTMERLCSVYTFFLIVFFQAAILYTSVNGQRRLRVLNLALNCCTQMSDLYRNCELDVIVNHMAKTG